MLPLTSWTHWGEDKETALPEANAVDEKEAGLEMVFHICWFPFGLVKNKQPYLWIHLFSDHDIKISSMRIIRLFQRKLFNTCCIQKCLWHAGDVKIGMSLGLSCHPKTWGKIHTPAPVLPMRSITTIHSTIAVHWNFVSWRGDARKWPLLTTESSLHPAHHPKHFISCQLVLRERSW